MSKFFSLRIGVTVVCLHKLEKIPLKSDLLRTENRKGIMLVAQSLNSNAHCPENRAKMRFKIQTL